MDLLAELRHLKMLAIIRADGPDRALDCIRTLVDAGITALEVSLTTPGAVDAIAKARSEYDPSILIGAGTLRADNPRLLVRSEARRAARLAQGLPEYPLKVTVTATANLSPELKTNVSFKSLIGRGSGEEFQMKFSGHGWVLIQPYEEVYYMEK